MESSSQSFGSVIVTVLFVSAIFWGAGLAGHKIFAEQRPRARHFYSSKKWVRLLGLRPKLDSIYPRYLVLQLLGLSYLLLGPLSALLLGWTAFKDVTGYVFVALFLLAIWIGFVDVLWRRKPD